MDAAVGAVDRGEEDDVAIPTVVVDGNPDVQRDLVLEAAGPDDFAGHGRAVELDVGDRIEPDEPGHAQEAAGGRRRATS